ncbi:hypothetical protein [Cupriavidus consociatus]|uniref:hypothetical protein n=1 Tax=Cupriavidus consociatus TaxID=2821357 RepID=UPI001AEA2F2D|nr:MULTISPECIES: hypothetical protein [unclassified Cupriavidus]MBP0624012.1 hypothetical protein [Cupriavidus sp. LEh25]MDK2660721.1 hypothetical protein [Cupriavidus sp. LEh21]
MTLLIDNDALLKLAQYDLLDRVVTTFGFKMEDVKVLHTAGYTLLPAKNRLRRCKTEECATRLEEFLAGATTIKLEDANADMIDMLSAPPNIDPGEALLLAAAASNMDAFVITGDKRALTALGEEESLAGVREALDSRVLSLELLFAFLVESDFEDIQSAVRNKPEADRALTNIFGVSAPASLESVRSALDSYINHLRAATGPLLHPPPELVSDKDGEG